MTDPTREQMLERIAEAIEKAAIVERESTCSYFRHDSTFKDDAYDIAEVAYGVVEQQVQVLQDRIAKVRDFAEDMKTWCSPHGVSLMYANRLLAVLDGVPETPEPTDLAVLDETKEP